MPARAATQEETKVLKPTGARTSIKDSGFHVEYHPRFYNRKRAYSILQQLEAEIEYDEKSEVMIRGEKAEIRRKQAAFGDPRLLYTYSGCTVHPRPFTPLLEQIRADVEKTTGKKFNFVLVNRYKDGLDRLGAHRDDEEDLEKGASIVGLSFGTPREIRFRHHTLQNPKGRLEPGETRPKYGLYKLKLSSGSLYEMKHPTNTYWFHEIPAQKSAGNNPRISLTFRVMNYREGALAPAQPPAQAVNAPRFARPAQDPVNVVPSRPPPPPPPRRGFGTPPHNHGLRSYGSPQPLPPKLADPFHNRNPVRPQPRSNSSNWRSPNCMPKAFTTNTCNAPEVNCSAPGPQSQNSRRCMPLYSPDRTQHKAYPPHRQRME